jgi:hypothetical protein
MQMLPNGDLWTAPVIIEQKNEAGETIGFDMEVRKDTLDISSLPQRAKMTPDVAAMLMADLERNKGAAK